MLLVFLFAAGAQAQQVQQLKPARLGIFKNGTCFIKREGMVTVAEKNFYIHAPEKALTGTYWVITGKESTVHSVIVKTDTFKVQRSANSLGDFLEANTGQDITLYGTSPNTDLRKLSGKLIRYDRRSDLVTVSSNGKTVVTTAAAFNWFESTGNPKNTVNADSVIPVAQIKITKEVQTVMASTISLETGVRWYPSYLFTVINDKEAKLEMKATIVNGDQDYLGMPVDIIIGSPEMFFGTQIDPACITYISQSLLENRYDNNGLYNFFNATGNASTVMQNTAAARTEIIRTNPAFETDADDKAGQKNGDLYYYNLGMLDLEKHARVIVPVMSATVAYDDIYSADIPPGSLSLTGENSVQTYHSYIIQNSIHAPLTSGSIFLLNKESQPLAQAKLFYTPVKGRSEINLSKAVDVQVGNDEETRKKEKQHYNNTAYTRSTVAGKITITNFKDKKIRIRITKQLTGYFETASNGGKEKKEGGSTQVYWETEVEPGGKTVLSYSYYTLEYL